jgi:hypothetical protein
MIGPTLGKPPFPKMESDVVYSKLQSPLTLSVFSGLDVGFNFSNLAKRVFISSFCSSVAVSPRFVDVASWRISFLSCIRCGLVMKLKDDERGRTVKRRKIVLVSILDGVYFRVDLIDGCFVLNDNILFEFRVMLLLLMVVVVVVFIALMRIQISNFFSKK